MVAAVSTTINPKATATRLNPKRTPLIPSEADNAIALSRRPKPRQVTSRYMSSTSSSSNSSSSSSSSSSSYYFKRCLSPAISRVASSGALMAPASAAPAAIKRPLSAERRGPATPLLNSADLRGASSTASGCRCAATMAPGPASPAAIKRSQSTERRRPATPLSNSADLRGASSNAGGCSCAARLAPVTAALVSIKRSQSAQRRRPATPLANSAALRGASSTACGCSSAATMTHVPTAPAGIKRSQSAERRRPGNPLSNSVDLRGASSEAGGAEMTSAQKMLVASVRSPSASFQGDSFSLQISKAKPVLSRSSSPATERRGTPERRKPASKVATLATVEQHRWPARLRAGNSLSRSVDITNERRKSGGSNTGSVVRALQSSTILNPRSLLDGRLSSSNLSSAVTGQLAEENCNKDSGIGSNDTSYSLPLDGDYASSQGNSAAQEGGTGGGGTDYNVKLALRGIVVPARFMQETNNRSRRQAEPCSPLSKNSGLKNMVSTPKFIGPKKQCFDSPVSSPKGILNTRGQSPIRGTVRPASPSNLASRAASSPRGMSPSRAWNATGDIWADNSNNFGSVPSISSFAFEIRKGKFGENRIVDAHALRLLHNRLLQWRFVNARADLALSAQKVNTERSLYNTWVSTTRLRESVRTKRFQLQLQKENLKLAAVLKGEMIYLEDWASIERDYSSSLAGATEALMASTICLPITGARADIKKMKNAISSAVDVMQTMASSICLLLTKVGSVNSSINELTNVVSKEHALLDWCRDLLSTCAALQAKEQSVKAHVLQLNCVPSSCVAKSRDSCCSVTPI